VVKKETDRLLAYRVPRSAAVSLDPNRT